MNDYVSESVRQTDQRFCTLDDKAILHLERFSDSTYQTTKRFCPTSDEVLIPPDEPLSESARRTLKRFYTSYD
jgi:hypothetical protein